MSYPVNLDLRGRRVVVIGAGEVAFRKVPRLLKGGASVTVVSPKACRGIRELARENRILLLEKPFQAEDLEGAALVMAATDDEAVNALVSAEAGKRGIWINVVDRPALCTFTVPALLRRGDLSVAVATEGRCPALARALRENLERDFGPEYGPLTALAGALRTALLRRGRGGPEVHRAVRDLLDSGLAAVLREGGPGALESFLLDRLGKEIAAELLGSIQKR